MARHQLSLTLYHSTVSARRCSNCSFFRVVAEARHLGHIQRVAPVMAGPVFDIVNERVRLAEQIQEQMHNL